MVSVQYTLQQITLTHFPMLKHTKKRKKEKKGYTTTWLWLLLQARLSL